MMFAGYSGSCCAVQGSLRVNRFNPYEGYVGSESVGQDILVAGRVAMNRALDGDIVAVELLPEEQWVCSWTKYLTHLPASSHPIPWGKPSMHQDRGLPSTLVLMPWQVGASTRLRAPEDAARLAVSEGDEDEESAEVDELARDQEGAGIAPQVLPNVCSTSVPISQRERNMSLDDTLSF